VFAFRAASNITKFFTGSEWDHCGMVVRPKPTMCLLVEWAGGLFISNLVERLTEYYIEDGREIVLRPLVLRGGERARKEAELEEYVRELFINNRGSNTIVPVGEVLSAARKQVFFLSDTDDKEDDLDVLFCSKTIAVCYKRIGLIPLRRRAADILPKHFSREHERFLALQGGAKLGPEFAVSFEPHILRQAVLAFFGVTQQHASRHAREVRAALAIQHQFRRHWERQVAERKRVDAKGTELERCVQCVRRCLPLATSRSPLFVERHIASLQHGGSRVTLLRTLHERTRSRAPRAPTMPRLARLSTIG